MRWKPWGMASPDPTRPRRAARFFGRIVRRERAYRGWTQEGLAEHAGLHTTFVGRLERGENQPTLETLLRLGEAFDLQPSSLLQEVETGWLSEP